mgnify:CR=1 FL=1
MGFFDLFSDENSKLDEFAEMVTPLLKIELDFIKMIPPKKHVAKYDDIYSIGYCFGLICKAGEEWGLDKQEVSNKSINIIGNLFEYVDEKKFDTLSNRINTCINKNSVKFDIGYNDGIKLYKRVRSTSCTL